MTADHHASPTASGRRLISLGFACNNRCVFCSQGDLRQTAKPPDRAAIEAEFEAIVAAGDSAVALVGGEPTVRDDLPALVARGREIGLKSILLQTNGRRLAYASYTRELAAAGLDRVEVSVQGARGDVHDYHTAVPGSLRHSLAGVRAAVDAGIGVAVTTVVTRSGYRHLAELVDRLAPLGIDALHFAIAQAHGRAEQHFDRVVPRVAAVAPQLRLAARRATRTNLDWVTSGLPLCALDGYEAAALELQPDNAPSADHTQGEPCERCSLASLCPGVSAPYAVRFGFGELEPRQEELAVRIRDRSRRLRAIAERFAGLGWVAPATTAPGANPTPPV